MIRPFRAEDGEPLALLLRADDPPHALTGAGIRHWAAHQPERARSAVLVAEERGGVAGWARARLRWATSTPGVGEIWGFVDPGLRSRGLGAALYEAARDHLREAGALVLESWSTGEEGGRFLAARGFVPTRTQKLLRLDLASADLSGLPALRAARRAEGYEAVSLAAVAGRAAELHALDAEAIADVPGTFAEDDVRLEDWLAEALGHPQLAAEGSAVVLHRGEPVAHALLHVDPEARLAANEMTGTRRDHRRRGLARLAKLETIAWARDHGYEAVLTASDQDNSGMLRLNRSLGYRRAGTETQYLLDELR